MLRAWVLWSNDVAGTVATSLSGELSGSLATALYHRNHVTNKEYAQNDPPEFPTWNESSTPLSNISFHVPPFSTKIPTTNDEGDYKYQANNFHCWVQWVKAQYVFPNYPRKPHQSDSIFLLRQRKSTNKKNPCYQNGDRPLGNSGSLSRMRLPFRFSHESPTSLPSINLRWMIMGRFHFYDWTQLTGQIGTQKHRSGEWSLLGEFIAAYKFRNSDSSNNFDYEWYF